MRKLTLHPDDLAVESFTTAAEAAGRGTAHAHAVGTGNPDHGLAPLPEETKDVFCTGETCRGLCTHVGVAEPVDVAAYPVRR